MGQATWPLVAVGAPARVRRSLDPHDTESTIVLVVPTVAWHCRFMNDLTEAEELVV